MYITTKRKVNKSALVQEISTEIFNEHLKEDIMKMRKPGSPGYLCLDEGVKPICHAQAFRKALQRVCRMTGNSTPSLLQRTYNHLALELFRDRVRDDLKDV